MASIGRNASGSADLGEEPLPTRDDPRFLDYILNPANHKPGIPLDYISYHFYASPTRSQNILTGSTPSSTRRMVFLARCATSRKSAKDFRQERSRISTSWEEVLPTDNTAAEKVPPPVAYWNLSGSMYAYLYVQLSRLQIDIIGESQLVGYPTQFPSVSMMNWIDNKPNARF